MSYSSIFTSANDAELYGRIVASCAQEGAAIPTEAAAAVLWPVVTAADVEAAYESALDSGNPNPGGDEAVITDGMILAHVQANLPAAKEE
jgi:hypothetical protein